MNDPVTVLEKIKDAELPVDAQRLVELRERLNIANLEARGLAIEEALRDPFIKPETANELLDELLEIDRELEKVGA